MSTRTVAPAAMFLIFSLLFLAGCSSEDGGANSPLNTSSERASSNPITASSAENPQVINVYEAVSPSVVNVTSVSHASNRFLGQVPQEGTGSGFVYDDQGHIVTNFHVVQGADELIVTFPDGTQYTGRVAGADPLGDIAVIQIDADTDLPPPLNIADPESFEVGQTVMAIGHPFGLDQTLTTGVISGLGRVVQSPGSQQFIGEAVQTDAAINPGNSGGPLLNLEGEVVGINSAILSPSGASAGIGFAISAETVMRIVPALIANGSYSHPWLGIQTGDLTPFVANLLREAGGTIPVDNGLLVVAVEPGSPAAEAGIQGATGQARFGPYALPAGGDIITAINGTAIATAEGLRALLENENSVGDTVDITLIRDGNEQTVSVTLAARPTPAGTPSPAP